MKSTLFIGAGTGTLILKRSDGSGAWERVIEVDEYVRVRRRQWIVGIVAVKINI